MIEFHTESPDDYESMTDEMTIEFNTGDIFHTYTILIKEDGRCEPGRDLEFFYIDINVIPDSPSINVTQSHVKVEISDPHNCSKLYIIRSDERMSVVKVTFKDIYIYQRVGRLSM